MEYCYKISTNPLTLFMHELWFFTVRILEFQNFKILYYGSSVNYVTGGEEVLKGPKLRDIIYGWPLRDELLEKYFDSRRNRSRSLPVRRGRQGQSERGRDLEDFLQLCDHVQGLVQRSVDTSKRFNKNASQWYDLIRNLDNFNISFSVARLI